MDNLARNAFLARQAGMSYGKWKAMQGPVKPPERKGYEKLGICKYCRKTFLQSRSNKRQYCDSYCKDEASKERAKQRLLERCGANG